MEDRSLSRRDAIGEAVIDVLALEGPRGLTHRRIDEKLGYPLGSTSGYYRRRSDLFRAGYEKLTALNAADMLAGLRAEIPDFDEGSPLELIAVARHHAQVWKVLTQQPHRLIANLEYLLQATRDDEIRHLVEQNIAREELFGAGLFARLGSKNSGRAAVRYSDFLHAESWVFLLVPPHEAYQERSEDFFRVKFEEIIKETDEFAHDVPLSRVPALPRMLEWRSEKR